MKKTSTVLVFWFLIAAVWCAAVPKSATAQDKDMKVIQEVVGIVSGKGPSTRSPQTGSGRTDQRFIPQITTICFMSAIQKFYISLLQGNNKDMQKAICGITERYNACVAPYKTRSSPKGKLAFDHAIKGAKYLCTKDGYKSYLELAPCLSDVHFVNQLNTCVQKETTNGPVIDFCSLFDIYLTCSGEIARISCASGSSERVRESLNVLLSPLKESICLAKHARHGSFNRNQFRPTHKLLSRVRRQGFEELSGLLGGGLDDLAGSLTSPEFAFGELSGASQMSPAEFAWGDLTGTQQGTPSEFAWGDLAGLGSQLSMPGFSLGGEAAGNEEQAGFPWEEFLTLPPFPAGQTGSSEEGAGLFPGFSTPEISSEEVTTLSPDVSTPEANSEEVSTALLDITTPETSSEEETTVSQDVTTQEPGSEEVSTTSPDATTPEDSSEEETTVAQDITTPEPNSEEVSTLSPDATTPEDSSEEETTIAQDMTTAEPNSEEVSTLSPDATTPEDSSEEETTVSQDFSTQEPNSEEEKTTAQPAVSTPKPEEPIVPDTTKLEPATVTMVEIPATTFAPIVTEPQLIETTTKGHHVPPFQCYECHSGAQDLWQNSKCPANGQIHGWAALPNLCYGQCVSVVTRFPKGDVYRSCSTNYYFPFQTPYDGCIKHNQELFCFCSGDFCNNRDMSQELKAYILEALIVLK